MRPGLGRVYIPDSRDDRYQLSRVVRSARTRRYWWSRWVGDQGSSSACTGFAAYGWLKAGPVTQPNVPADATTIYHRARQLDEWPGENYDGSSVRGAMKALRELGFVQEFRWGRTIGQLAAAILDHGPVVLGTDWTEEMFDPDPDSGEVSIGGPLAGGHAYLAIGINTETKMIRCVNSWGRGWGQQGRFWISFSNMERLLAGIAYPGEVSLAIEAKGAIR